MFPWFLYFVWFFLKSFFPLRVSLVSVLVPPQCFFFSKFMFLQSVFLLFYDSAFRNHLFFIVVGMVRVCIHITVEASASCAIRRLVHYLSPYNNKKEYYWAECPSSEGSLGRTKKKKKSRSRPQSDSTQISSRWFEQEQSGSLRCLKLQKRHSGTRGGNDRHRFCLRQRAKSVRSACWMNFLWCGIITSFC